MQHRTIYLNAIDQRRADKLRKRNAGLITLLATLAACLALSGPCAVLFAASTPSLSPMLRVALGLAGCGAIIAASSIPSYIAKRFP